MKRLLMILCAMLLVFVLSGIGNASIVTIVERSAWYNYAVLTTDLYDYGDTSVWENAGYGSFDWDNASWVSKQAAFTSRVLTGWDHTYWEPNTDLALQKTYHLDGVLTDLTLKVSSDNGFIAFINGTQVAKENAAGYIGTWPEYTFTNIDPSAFIQGDNTIEVLAEDHGVYAHFNMELTGNIVPIPCAVWLLGSGLIGIAGIRRKFKE